MPDETPYIVAVKPAPGYTGPTLVSDDPSVVQAVLDAISRTYLRDRVRVLRLDRQPTPDDAA